ncbi:inclusion body matrix protein [Silene caulimovirus A]|nr:inclusion body matrix protein [Silene caulimovirus A]
MSTTYEKKLRLEIQLAELKLETLKKELELVVSFGHEHQEENSSPRSLSHEESSPEQTATGKDESNPLMPTILAKDVSEFPEIQRRDILRPNMGKQIPIKEASTSQSCYRDLLAIPTAKNYYVIFNGNNAGIYDDWDYVKRITNGVSNIKFQKFKSILEARTAADIFTRSRMVKPLEVFPREHEPKNFAKALSRTPSKMKSLGKPRQIIMKEPSIEEVGFNQDFSLGQFLYISNYARRLDPEGFLVDHAFTSDGKEISYLNFDKNASPEAISEAFRAGIIKNIYPSNNLQEIKLLPEGLRKAVKQFRTKCLKNGDGEIFIKIKSSLPVWDNIEEGFTDLIVSPPFYLIQVGISKGVMYSPSTVMDTPITRSNVQKLTELSAVEFCKKVQQFVKQEKIFVIYLQDNMLIYSTSPKKSSEEDKKAINAFSNQVLTPRIMGYHCDKVCAYLQKSQKESYSCPTCAKAKGKGKAQDECSSA